MTGVQRISGGVVVVPAELCPALSRLLRLGMQAARSNGYRVPDALRSAVDAISSEGAEAAMSQSRQGISSNRDMAPRFSQQQFGCADAADVLRVTKRTVQRWAASGDLHGTRVNGRWIFERTTLDEFKQRERG